MKLTNFAPSITALISGSPDIMALAAGRAHILNCLLDGTLDVQAKTVKRWDQALWIRAVELMQAAPNPAYVYNVCFTWWNAVELAEFQRHYRKRIAA
jgi:hypothetical protein